MKIYCTTCCKEKSTDEGKIPAIHRYLDERIKTIYHKSQEDNVGFRIFSGKYGILSATDKIPWYDQALLPNEINNMIDLLTVQIKHQNISSIIFYAKNPLDFPDWEPYITAMVGVSEQNNLILEVKFI